MPKTLLTRVLFVMTYVFTTSQMWRARCETGESEITDQATYMYTLAGPPRSETDGMRLAMPGEWGVRAVGVRRHGERVGAPDRGPVYGSLSVSPSRRVQGWFVSYRLIIIDARARASRTCQFGRFGAV